MAPPVPPPEQVAESATPTPADAQRSLPTPFLTKTYQLVDDPAIDDLISWNEDGSTFVVWRPAEFARDLLPKYFKHNNFSSFVRQLNTYGFRKIVPDRWEFANDCFRRGEKRLLLDIQRRKIQTPAAAVTVTVPAHGVTSPTNSRDDEQAFSSNSSPGFAPDTSVRGSGGASSELVEDNNRLKKENERLKRELSQIKNLCNSVLLLMSKYASQQRQHQPSASVGGCAWGAEKPPPPPCPLELMRLTRCSSVSEPAIPVGDNRVKPDDDDDDAAEEAAAAAEEEERGPSPRLFGVPIGIKRLRGGAEESAEDEKLRHPRVVEVKLESVDPIPSAVEPPLEVARHRWRTFDGGCRPSKQRECN